MRCYAPTPTRSPRAARLAWIRRIWWGKLRLSERCSVVHDPRPAFHRTEHAPPRTTRRRSQPSKTSDVSRHPDSAATLGEVATHAAVDLRIDVFRQSPNTGCSMHPVENRRQTKSISEIARLIGRHREDDSEPPA